MHSATPQLVLSSEQASLAEAARAAATARWEPRDLLTGGPPEPGTVLDLWRTLDQDLGLRTLAVPDAAGGDGGGVADLCVVAEEFGRLLIPAPLVTQLGVLVPLLLSQPGSEASSLLADVLAG